MQGLMEPATVQKLEVVALRCPGEWSKDAVDFLYLTRDAPSDALYKVCSRYLMRPGRCS